MLVCINQGATALAHLITDLKVLHLPTTVWKQALLLTASSPFAD